MSHRSAARAPLAGALAVLAAAAGVVLARPPAAEAGSLGRALDHLAAHQDPSGGFAAGAGTDPSLSAWAAMAVASAGESPAHWRAGRSSLREAIARPLDRPILGDVARAAVAAVASGLDPRDVGGRNLVREVLRAQAGDGAIGDGANTTSWGILALRAGGLATRSRAVGRARAALERLQRGDGGWSSAVGSPGSSVNTTAAAVQALVAAGRDPGRSLALRRARQFLLGSQNPDGGFPVIAGSDSTALTTAWIAVAVRAFGERPSASPWSRAGGPVAFLRRLQLPDGGVRNTRFSSEASIWATAEAALAFAGRPLPLRAARSPVTAERAPRIVRRRPRAGRRIKGPILVAYRDERGGTGVDPRAVRITLDGRDVTYRATITPLGLTLPGAAVPAGGAVVRLSFADRAGNARSVLWRVARRGR